MIQWTSIREPRTLSLRALLIVPFVVLIFAAVGLTGFISFRNGQQSVNKVASELRHEINFRIQERLRTYLETPKSINRINADAVRFGTFDLQESDRVSSIFWQQIQAFELMSLIYVGKETGDYVGATRKDKAITVNRVNASAGGFYSTYVPGDWGQPTTLISAVTDRVYDPRKRSWYIATTLAKKPIWSPIYTFFDPPSLGITATHPLYAANAQLIAVFATDLSLGTISQFLSGTAVGKTGQSFILERSGLLIATSTPDPPFRLLPDGTPEPIKGDQSRNIITQSITKQLEIEFGDLSRLDRPQQFDLTLNGERLLAEVAPIKDALGIDWLTVVVIPESDFMEQINSNARTTILLCLLTLAIATAAGVLIARWIIHPIRQLGAASRAIALGDLSRQVKLEGIIEIDTVGQSFNQMAHQLRESFTALEAVNRDLENRVETRTAELTQANQEINLLNDRLHQENRRMGAELDVARQLQQMILPKPDELSQIPDLEIVGFMEVAAEVGGDYYDVIEQTGRVTIGIGDVTGHGLESGVLMIMAQTAVRTLIAAQERDPVKFLGAVNQVIYQNAQRMSPGKNLTLALLDYQDGQLQITGQHEEVLVVRDGCVERIDTIDLGFPIGMIDDIDAFIGQTQIPLNSGDSVVLYTDGITEAEGDRRNLYGLERLIRVIATHSQQTASQIREAVIADVYQHIGQHPIYDDITLVVLKKK
jgi:sigma-B regulation protein RsbU (phosphoserine phosphatase)